MKPLFAVLLLCFVVLACKKEVTGFYNQDGYLEQVKAALKDSIGPALVEQLDFSHAIRSDVDSVDLHVLNIPLLSTGAGSFILVQTDKQGNIRQGRLITLEKEYAIAATGRQYNGSVTVRSLKQEVLLQSAVIEGRIVALHQRRSSSNMRDQVTQAQVVPADEEMLPEVIVVGYRDASGGISYSDWVSLQSMFGSSAGIPSNSYNPARGSGGASGSYSGSGSGSDGSSNGTTKEVSPMELEKEDVYSLPAVNIRKVFKCFDYVPSQGATYKIRLCTDLPSNNYPNASANYSAVSAGHTFLIVTKSNDELSVTQSFGFYPQSVPSWVAPFSSVAATIRDNGAQEINASIEMNINEYQFNTVKQNAIDLSSKAYNLGDYNCTNYALDVFNSVRTSPIVVQPYKVVLPGSTDAYNVATDPISVLINESPQMLFSELREMKYRNSAQASGIMVDQSHNSRAPISKGECD